MWANGTDVSSVSVTHVFLFQVQTVVMEEMGMRAEMLHWNMLILLGLMLLFYAVGFLGLYIRVRWNR